MITPLKKRIAYLRTQPEHIRMRAASVIALVAGVFIVILWLTVLLPVQLYLHRDSPSEPEVGMVAGTNTPSPTPVPTQAQVPALLQLQELPQAQIQETVEPSAAPVELSQ